MKETLLPNLWNKKEYKETLRKILYQQIRLTRWSVEQFPGKKYKLLKPTQEKTENPSVDTDTDDIG